CAALTFGASLDRLLATPRLYGWTWDISAGNPYSGDLTSQAVPILDRATFIRAYRPIAFENLVVDGIEVDALGLGSGAVRMAMLSGREPNRSTEIALGARTLRRLHRHIGDDVM